MNIRDIYGIGEMVPFDSLRIASWDRKLRFVEFPYDSKAILFTAIILFLTFFLFNVVAAPISEFLSYTAIFFALASGIITLFYPLNIFYLHAIGKYNEEMLTAVMRLSTYVSMNTSIEHAFYQVTPEIHGILHRQFTHITEQLDRKQKTTLGDALEPYVPIWNEHNPVFVKSIRLLQTASYASADDREKILAEMSETLLWNYTTLGKRYAEDLSNKAKKLIMLGVLFPIMMLMLLPMITIFMPDLVNPSILAFMYIVLFPMITLALSLNFAAKRVQVSTIRIEESQEYRPMGKTLPIILGLVVLGFFIYGLWDVILISEQGSDFSEPVWSLLPAWLAAFSLTMAVIIYGTLYTRRYSSLWNDIYQIEQDLPHLLQSFSTYQTLNLPMENVIPEVVRDYQQFGFGNHPVVRAFEKILLALKTTKKNFVELTKGMLTALIPSPRVNSVLEQMVSFSEISQDSSAKVAGMIRQHTLSIHKLDDYMKTLLSDTLSLINITTTMLAPLLSAAAVLMSIAIVKSIVFIEDQMARIGAAFGVPNLSLQLIEVDNIISPQLMQFIIGIYLVETIIILTLFATVINIGNDRYSLMNNLKSNMLGFFIYSAILFGGYITIQMFFQTTFG